YESDKPFKGLRLESPEGEEGGYLIINYTTNKNDVSTLPVDLRGPRRLDPVTLGVDFGSTNTSLAYSISAGTPEGFSFTNQRVSLFGNERPGTKSGLKENRILFFQGREKPLPSNGIHSVLTLHDKLRLPKLGPNQSNASRLSQEVVGGFPCFMDNLPVQSVTRSKITLNYPNIGQIDQIHNMKWDDAEEEKAHKIAFLKTLMLQTYAQLFLMEKVPVALRWSYPSSMSNTLLNTYQTIFSSLEVLKPVLKEEYDENGVHHPYELNVSRFRSRFKKENRDTLGRRTTAAGRMEEENKGLFPDNPNRVVNYNPRPIFANDKDRNISLTEANAVANFMSGFYGQQVDQLYLCFDIGGSTTDISALYMLSNGLTMIKQNSIRFAAQRVSEAAGHVKGFEKVLKQICERFDITILGLNQGERRYSDETAPYYFNQIVDRLDDSQLPEFYSVIASDCPQLMWINMYVTGLLLYYAGQIANKLVDDIHHLSRQEWVNSPAPQPYGPQQGYPQQPYGPQQGYPQQPYGPQQG
ncbi:MAG: YppG family protein, partial [Muribaculaceae bacterium]|nr:YppG family protein [Muribaculaceae bacterium]